MKKNYIKVILYQSQYIAGISYVLEYPISIFSTKIIVLILLARIIFSSY